jgi:hypothetical protein
VGITGIRGYSSIKIKNTCKYAPTPSKTALAKENTNPHKNSVEMAL